MTRLPSSKTLLLLFFVATVTASGCADEALPQGSLGADLGRADGFGPAPGFPVDCDRTYSGISTPDRGTLRHRVALTFDDGPTRHTAAILDVLRDKGRSVMAEGRPIPATFFINGHRLEDSREWSAAEVDPDQLFERMVGEGHMIGNHTFSHLNTQASFDRWRADFLRNHDLLVDLLGGLGLAPRYFRFPQGMATCDAIDLVREHGYEFVGWHSLTADYCYASRPTGECRGYDWIPREYWSDHIGYALYQARAQGGGIMVLHDTSQFTVEELPRLIDALVDAGFGFTSLDDVETFPILNRVPPPRVAAIGDGCEEDDECAYSYGNDDGYCHRFADPETGEPRGICTLRCDGYCMLGGSGTFCVARPGFDGEGMCVLKGGRWNDCATMPGTAEVPRDRFIDRSRAPAEDDVLVCLPG